MFRQYAVNSANLEKKTTEFIILIIIVRNIIQVPSLSGKPSLEIKIKEETETCPILFLIYPTMLVAWHTTQARPKLHQELLVN